jgi:ribonucleoside-diphosphate reductase alpha chain
MPTATQASFSETVPSFPVVSRTETMHVRKRNGSLESVNVNKIVRAVERCCEGLAYVDPMRIASKTIGGLYDGATTKELDSISIQTAALLIAEEPEYSKLAARLLLGCILKELTNQDIFSFSQSIAVAAREDVVSSLVADFVRENARKLNTCIDERRSDLFEYFGLRTLYDRYCCAILRVARFWRPRNIFSCVLPAGCQPM